MSRRLQLSLGLILGGTALLLLTTGTITVGALIAPVLLMCVGAILLARAFLPQGRERNIFSGTAAVLSGGFWLLWESALPSLRLEALWPVFMTIGGLALMAYGFRKGPYQRASLVVPGVMIVVLSVIFLMFSLDVITQSLAQVAVRWWPATLIVIGGLLSAGSLLGSEEDTDDVEDAESENPTDLS